MAVQPVGIHQDVLDGVETLTAQFVTVKPAAASGTISSQFQLSGRMRFLDLPFFDAFSFGNVYDPDTNAITFDGYLTFANLFIDMSYTPDGTDPPAFTFRASGITFDPVTSIARGHSLFRHFPLKINGLVVGSKGTSPGDLGYMKVTTPLEPSTFSDIWFGLTFDIDLGTLGALAGDLGLVMTVLAAWGPSIQSGSGASFGIKLPGSSSASTEIPIEGILKLGFRAIEFTSDGAAEDRAYMLKFRQFALRLFTLSFPPGNIDVYLFGDPSGRDSSALGWYAAYAKDLPEQTPKLLGGRRG